MIQFHETGLGRKFFEGQLPELIHSLKIIERQLERSNTIREEESNLKEKELRFKEKELQLKTAEIRLKERELGIKVL